MKRLPVERWCSPSCGRGLLAALGLVVLAVCSRTYGEIPNFKPVGAVCLLAPLVMCSGHRWSWLVPPGVVLGSELFLAPRAGILMIPLTLSWTINVMLGFVMRRHLARRSISRFSGLLCNVGVAWITTFLAGLQFYLITNFAVWCGTNWYAPNLVGLVQCFVAGLPFFRWTLQADIMFGWLPLSLAMVATYCVRLVFVRSAVG